MPMDTCQPSTPGVQEDTRQEIKPKMSSGRRSSKPLMEKRRRARINDSLGQLKSLILEATNKDSSRHSKLEKADILEMTVKYLRNMQRGRMSGSVVNNSAELNRYRLGYSECIGEVSRYLDTSESAVQLRTQLIGHLANRVSPPSSPVSQQPPQSIAFTPSPSPAPVVAAAAMVPPPTSHHSVQVQVAGAPSITGGEIRVVLPPEALPNGQLPSHFIPVYAHCTPSPTSSTSSMDTPPSPTQSSRQSSFQHTQELSSQVSYEQHHGQQQTVPYTYMQGVAPTTTSPLVGSTAPSVIPRATVQSPSLVTLPAADAQTTATEIKFPAQARHHVQQQIHDSVPQHHFYYQSSPLKAENVTIQQQCAAVPTDESVWRPW